MGGGMMQDARHNVLTRLRFPKTIDGGQKRTMTHCPLSLILILSLISGCGAFAAHESGGPASHHAQRKYDEAVRKGVVAPAEKGTDDRK
jgi:hypothetical protein